MISNKFFNVLTLLLAAALLGFSIFWGYQHFFNEDRYDINDFKRDHNLSNVTQIDIEGKSYIFSGTSVYVYYHKEKYQVSRDNYAQGYLIGGLEKGSIGIVDTEKRITDKGTSYSVIDFSGEERWYDHLYKNKDCLVIVDERIWNPSPRFTVVFYDENKEVLDRLNINPS
ncbi:hypothetical protein [Cohnella massiliensis]|uniref:hypothetical protein n=1 Tax=Cohnella massiliensis TaxID=1816691 RepID=UPI0009BB17EA|nr:hypothetical protein [Cohnella massiliensis]